MAGNTMSISPLVELLTICAAAVVVAVITARLTGLLVLWLARRRYERFLVRLHEAGNRAWTALLVFLALFFTVSTVGPPGDLQIVALRILTLASIASVAWLLTKVLFVAEDAALEWLRVDVPNNRRIRRIRTQVSLLRRLTVAVIVVVAFAAMLMTFDPLRALGASLLGSAAVAGAIAGLAAQTTLAHVFAGLQLAVSDALRLDDVVVVEKEWGRIEDLTLTYVVVRLWDERHLVLPTTYFTTQPFENWTRRESRVIGAVLLHVDYMTPMGELREEAGRVVDTSPLWDRRDWVVQVIDTTPTTMIVRVLASARDAPTAWDLRCEIRERLIDYLRTAHPEALPRARVDLAELRAANGVEWQTPAELTTGGRE